MRLPRDEFAERAVLKGVLIDNAQIEAARALISTRDFYELRHQKVFRAVERLSDRGGALDLVTLRTELATMGDLEDVGGVMYLQGLVDGAARSTNVEHYARIVREKSIRRTMMNAGAAISEAAGNGHTLDDLEAMLPAYVETFSLACSGLHGIAGSKRLEEFDPEQVEYAVKDLLPKKGLVMLYGPGGVGKTYTLAAIATTLLAFRGGTAYGPAPTLFGNPDLPLRLPWRRVAWVSAEETGGVLRQRWDKVLRGLGFEGPKDVPGELLYRWAFDGRSPFTLDRTDALLDGVGGHVDALILDSWTSLVPPVFDGRPIEWDRDNFAARRLLNVLRAIAVRRDVLIVLVHHTGKEPGNGPRGPSEFRNSVDALIALEKRPERRISMKVEKQREGRDEWSFTLGFTFTGDGVQIRHEERPAAALKGAAQTVLAYLTGAHGRASLSDLVKGTNLARATVQSALKQLETAGIAADSGEKAPKGSPIWYLTKGADEVPNDAQ